MICAGVRLDTASASLVFRLPSLLGASPTYFNIAHTSSWSPLKLAYKNLDWDPSPFFAFLRMNLAIFRVVSIVMTAGHGLT